MKRCKFCGRAGVRMLELPSGYFMRVPPGREKWACHNRAACARRAAQIGQWTGARVLRRADLDGTRWTIRTTRQRDGVSGGQWFVLTCEYRQHRSTSWHLTAEAAKAHRDDVTASWEARSMREYGAAQ